MTGSLVASSLSRDELEARLEEAEETLRAIREGEIDAVVVQGTTTTQVFTLEGETQSFRTFMETMEIGAAAFDADRRLIYANQALARVFNCRSAELKDQGLSDLLSPVSQNVLRRLLSQGLVERQSAEIHLSADGQSKSFILSAAPLELGTTCGVALTMTDVSDRDQAAAALESERLARAIIASANEAVIVCDRSAIVTHVNAAGLRICNGDPVGKAFEEAITLTLSGSSGIMSGADIALMAIGGTPVQGLEAAVKAGSADVTDVLISAAPLTISADRVQGCVVTLINLSQRKSVERQQSLLMGELDHRVKNTLTMVLAISARTAANEQTIEGFQKSFSGRIQALAATHNLLSGASWENLSIEQILRAEIEPYASLSSNRVRIEGLDVKVYAQKAVSLGLIFHELTTNAVKYGALSSQFGKLSIRALGRSDNDKAFGVLWEETGGPKVVPPTSSGFGKTLILRSLGDGAGGAAMDFKPEGLVCKISVPV